MYLSQQPDISNTRVLLMRCCCGWLYIYILLVAEARQSHDRQVQLATQLQTQNTRLEKELATVRTETAQLTQKSSDATRRMTEMQHLLEQERVQAGEAERA